jgi:hypothetical protein
MQKGKGGTHLCLTAGSVAGVLGFLALLAAWYSTWKGAFWGLGAGHWYEDAKTLFLLALVCYVCNQVGIMHGWGCTKCGGGKCCGEEECKGCGADCEHCEKK